MKNCIKKSLKASNGITLIALVVTIIVLLILAGISISMLSGDNGILQKATDAKTNTGNSQIQEQINLAYHSALTSGLGKVEESKLKDEIKKEFNKTDSELEEKNWLDKTSVAGKWRITIDGVYLDVPAGTQDNQDNGKVSIKVGTKNLKDESDLSTLYGKTTDFTSVEGVEWQLFFDDTNNIYLIASDYVPVSTLTQATELIKESGDATQKYKACFATWDSSEGYKGQIMESEPWSKGTESSTITGNELKSKYLKWVNSSIVETKNNPNMKAVAYMMDTSKWNNFAGSVSGAYAIGGPTLEMFVLSYNAKHDTKLGTYGTSESDINSTNANANGYMVKIGDDSWNSNQVSGLDTSGTGGNMWVRTNTDKAYMMWLASPSSSSMAETGNGGELRVVQSDGSFNPYYSNPSSLFAGFRPLVVIPKSSLK